jgi:hypothetical protein
MNTKKNLREELLSQNHVGTQPGDALRDKVLAQDQARVVRMRKLTICSWIVVGTSLVAAGVVRVVVSSPDIAMDKSLLVPTFIIVWQALLLIAIFFTISLYVRSRTLTMHQIQSSLALIEEHLKKMSQKE